MACTVSGAYLSVTAIPQAWQAKHEKREYIEKLTLELADMKEQEGG